MTEELIRLVQQKIPDFTRRVMTFEDVLAVCARENLSIELREHHLDEQLLRRPAAKIILNAGLSERYRTFAGFHALAHWYAHPGSPAFYLGSPGWLDQVELEASQIGFLALSPADGPPYPRLVRARVDPVQLEFWVEYPERQPGGRVRWRPRRTRLGRLAASTQEELPL
jgi:hypothetical protein